MAFGIVYIGATDPAAKKHAKVWIDTSGGENVVKIRNKAGNAWIVLDSAAQADLDIEAALDAHGLEGEVGADGTPGLVTMKAHSGTPGGLAGQVVADSDGVKLKYSADVAAEVTSDGFVINSLGAAGYFTVGAAAPAVAAVGALWFDTGAGKLNVCTAASDPGPAVWTPVH